MKYSYLTLYEGYVVNSTPVYFILRKLVILSHIYKQRIEYLHRKVICTSCSYHRRAEPMVKHFAKVGFLWFDRFFACFTSSE